MYRHSNSVDIAKLKAHLNKDVYSSMLYIHLGEISTKSVKISFQRHKYVHRMHSILLQYTHAGT